MSEEPEYVVNQQQLALLRSKKLPFEIILKGNTHARENGHA